MTTPALVAKQKGCNAFYAGLDDNSNFALGRGAQAVRRQAQGDGLPDRVRAEPHQLDGLERGAGGLLRHGLPPVPAPERRDPARCSRALEKYEHFTSSEFPTFSQYESWLGADLMIKGLELAGKNPTQAGVIHALRNLKSYNGNGLLPETINYSTDFGHDLPQSCGWYMVAEKNGFVATSSTPYCGKDLPGTTTVQS